MCISTRTVRLTWIPPLASLFVFLAAACGQQTQTPPEQLLRQAQSALEASDWSRCAHLARQLAKSGAQHSRYCQKAAELLYRTGEVEDSLPLFDRAIALDPQLAPHNWQRGIALATAGRWADAADQFTLHHQVNPDDVENSAWHYLCVAKSEGIPAAARSLIPSRGDSRPPMMEILRLFRGEADVNDVLAAASRAGRSNSPEQRRAQFYAHLYIGLYHDAHGRKDQAIESLQQAVAIGQRGYMADVARVYLNHRRRRPAAEQH